MSRTITFQVGIPAMSVTVNLDEVTEDKIRGLIWWQRDGPKDICPFIFLHFGKTKGLYKCKYICGRIFPNIENVYKTCPFKQKYNQVTLTALVQRVLDELGK